MTDAPESVSRAADAENETGSADAASSALAPSPVDSAVSGTETADSDERSATPDDTPEAAIGEPASSEPARSTAATETELADTDTAATETDATETDATETDATEPNGASGEHAVRDRQVDVRLLEREGDIAADYLEGLLDIADLDGDIDMDVEADRASVSIVGGDLKSLVGRDGQVLEALQELTRLAVQAKTGGRSRLMLDIAGHRAARRRQLSQIARRAVDDARRTGQPVRLDPMTPFERKVVHDTVAAAGLSSESEGAEPSRCVVVLPG